MKLLTYDERRRIYAAASADPEARALRQRAREWRSAGDHIAAGDCERDAAACVRIALRRLTAEAES